MDSNDANQQEKTFYEDKNVLVTNSRFVASGKTYAMRNISSVSNFRIRKSTTGPIFLILLGVVIMLFGGTALIFGLILAGIGIAILFLTKDDYSVKISSNSGESKALISSDRSYVQKVVDALNEAIIYRG